MSDFELLKKSMKCYSFFAKDLPIHFPSSALLSAMASSLESSWSFIVFIEVFGSFDSSTSGTVTSSATPVGSFYVLLYTSDA